MNMTSPSSTLGNTPDTPSSQVSSPPHSQADHRLPMPCAPSTADYDQLLEAANKAGIPIYGLNQIAKIRRGRHCPTGHLAKEETKRDDFNKVQIITGRNDRHKVPLDWYDHYNLRPRTFLVPEVADTVDDEEILEDGDLLLTIEGKPGRLRGVTPPSTFFKEFMSIRLPGEPEELPDEPKKWGCTIASDRFAVIRIDEPFRHLSEQQYLCALLKSAPYQNAFRSLAGKPGSTRLEIAGLGRIRIPDLPVEKRHLIKKLSGNNVAPEATPWPHLSLIEAMIKVITTDFASAPAIRHFTTNKDWTDFIKPGVHATTEQRREILARLGTHARAISEQTRDESKSFSEWALRLGEQAEYLETMLAFPTTAEKIVALQKWRRDLERSDHHYNLVEQQYADTVQSDPPSLRNHLSHHFQQIRSALAKLAKRCEDEIAQDFEPFQELNMRIHRQESEFREDLCIKRHRLAQVIGQIRSGLNTVAGTLVKNGSISGDDLIGVSGKNFREYLESIERSCRELGEVVEQLTGEIQFEQKAPVNLIKDLSAVASEYKSADVQIMFKPDFPSFVDENGSITPNIQIGRNDFRDLCRNIIENATKHGFSPKPKDAEIRIELSFLKIENMFQVVFKNNGKPMPRGMDTERFVLRGERAGPTGNSGIGGYRIKQIMDYVGGTLEVVSRSNEAFPVQIILRFPPSYE